MTFLSMRACAGLAIAVLSFAAPAGAQHVTFTDIRDAVPLKFFSAALTQPDPSDAKTLVIGFESGTNSFRASAEVNNQVGTRVALDTLSFNVRAPSGSYVSSITYHQAGRGAVNTPADARAASSWVVNGQPLDLGSRGPFPLVGATWSNSQTVTFTASSPTVVPVSLTTELFAFAAQSLASADVEFSTATIVVTFAQGPTVTGSIRQ